MKTVKKASFWCKVCFKWCISKKRTLFYIDGGRVFVRRPMCTIISAWEQIFVTLKGCNFFP